MLVANITAIYHLNPTVRVRFACHRSRRLTKNGELRETMNNSSREFHPAARSVIGNLKIVIHAIGTAPFRARTHRARLGEGLDHYSPILASVNEHELI